MTHQICTIDLFCRIYHSKIGREIKKPVELYHQNCVLKATVMQNRRDRLNGPQRSKAMSERKKKSRELTKKKMLEEAAKEKRNEEMRVKKEREIMRGSLRTFPV